MLSFFSKLKKALAKTRQALSGRITSLFKGTWDESTFEKLEQILYEADLGSECASYLVDETRAYLKRHKEADIEEILALLREKAVSIFETPPKIHAKEGKPKVTLVVGVNGSGKTTSIAKLARKEQKEGKTLLLAAGDTFRAAAIDQLSTWAEKLGCGIIKSSPGADPASVAFDAATSAKARGVDLLIIDTAGRLQNKTDLMKELEKVVRVLQKVLPDAPHEILLVLDATTGQNAVDQAEIFHQFTPLTGIVLSKLDGTAKGGIVLSIYKKLGIPVKWIGTGEGLDDLSPFQPKDYANALFGGR